jgi:DNA-binding NtrC family response regulator
VTRRLLIVDDEEAIRDSLSAALRAEGLDVSTAETAESALAQIDALRPELVLSDIRMPGLDGVELLRLLRERAPSIDVILMTAYQDMPTVIAAMRAGAVEFLTKPLDLDELLRLINTVFDDRRLRKRHASEAGVRPARLDELIGTSAAMVAIYKLIGQAAATSATVLLRGESGTGKELVARAIHANSALVEEPFVAVNCAALPTGLLESELFGHVRGAFTGAQQSRRGRFAAAGRGTILLDEIGDTTPEFQTKLLRVLQEREYHPVGADAPEHTDARVIAATHQHLEQLVADGRFRSDLYFRLRVVEIPIPPLRDRRADIPLLARHLAQRTSEALRVARPTVSDEALALLMAYDWPGNVRELENCLMRAVVLAAGGVIRPEHLSMTPSRKRGDDSFASLDEAERDHVARVLAATHGNKTRAAEILQVNRPRLDRLIRRHGLSADGSDR